MKLDCVEGNAKHLIQILSLRPNCPSCLASVDDRQVNILAGLLATLAMVQGVW